MSTTSGKGLDTELAPAAGFCQDHRDSAQGVTSRTRASSVSSASPAPGRPSSPSLTMTSLHVRVKFFVLSLEIMLKSSVSPGCVIALHIYITLALVFLIAFTTSSHTKCGNKLVYRLPILNIIKSLFHYIKVFLTFILIFFNHFLYYID